MADDKDETADTVPVKYPLKVQYCGGCFLFLKIKVRISNQLSSRNRIFQFNFNKNTTNYTFFSVHYAA